MKKYFDTITNKEVKLGEYVERETKEEFSFGTYYSKSKELLTEVTAPVLIKKGLIREEEIKETPKNDVPMDITYYIHKVAEKMQLSDDMVCSILDRMNSSYKTAVLQILLKEVASVLNHKKGGYKIPDTKYCINMETGKIYPVTMPKSKFVTCFYEIEDAKLARDILKSQFELMYGKDC